MEEGEYEPELYTLEHLYLGITDGQRDPDTGRPRIIGAIFVNDKSSLMTKDITFGLIIQGEGRRLAMNDPNYSKEGLYEYIGECIISETKNYSDKKFVQLNTSNQYDFEELLSNNSKLRAEDKNKHGGALLDYVKNKKYGFEDGALVLMRKATQAHIAKKYNSGFLGTATKKDRAAAKGAYNHLS